MLSRMAPSSPPVMRTLHLLKTPDILCANDSRPPGNYFVVNIPREPQRAIAAATNSRHPPAALASTPRGDPPAPESKTQICVRTRRRAHPQPSGVRETSSAAAVGRPVIPGLTVIRPEQSQSHERPAICRLRVSNSRIAQTPDAGMPIILAISMSIRGALVLIDS
jgi:hypothetical protein